MVIYSIKDFFCPDLCKGRLAILDIYLRIMCFLYPLYLGDAKIFVSFSEKEFLYYILTLLTALLYLFFPLQKGKTARKRLCRIDSILLLLAVLFIIKGSIRIILQEDNFETDIFFVCLIVTFFLLKSFSGNFVHYLNLVLFSSFLLYLDMLYYYLTERQGILGADILLRQPEAASWLLFSFCISSVLYEKGCITGWRNFYLLVSILGSVVLFLFGNIAAICMAGVFLLLLPLFYQPTVTLIKRNLVLCFVFLGIMTNLPLLQYLTDVTLHENILTRYGIYIDLFLLCLGGGIKAYWKKVPCNRNPEAVLMRKFQKWYKQSFFIIVSFALLLFTGGSRMLDIPDNLGNEFIRQLYMNLNNDIYKNNSFAQNILINYGLIGFVLWLYLLMEIFKKFKKHQNENREDKKICQVLAVTFLFATFFYPVGPFCAPVSIILISFALTECNGNQVNSKVSASFGDETDNEKNIIFNKCGSNEILL